MNIDQINTTTKYLCVCFYGYKKLNSFQKAIKYCEKNTPDFSGVIYEKVGSGTQALWCILATIEYGEILSEILGHLPND